jgi:hypothetical protein
VYSHVLSRAGVFLTRGPSCRPRSRCGHGTSLTDTFLHSAVSSTGWRAGAAVAELLGPAVLVVLVLAALSWWLLRGRRGHR